MADNVAVVEPVVQTPVTIAPTQAVEPVVTTPEPDILTKISQFKLPETQDKIDNPPDQPEFANITDPVAKKAAAEAVERMRRGLQSSYDKKLQDAQALVNQSKSWTPQRIQQELLTNPEFVTAAQMINGQTNTNDRPLTTDEYSALTETEKAQLATVTKLEKELNNMKNQATNEQIRAAISQKDLTLRTTYPEYDSKAVDEACVRLGQMNLADVREFVHKAINYEKNSLKSYEYGKLEGQGKLQTKINTIAPQGSTTVTSNEGLPVRNKGESDQAFFVKLAQFRLTQSKNQK